MSNQEEAIRLIDGAPIPNRRSPVHHLIINGLGTDWQGRLLLALLSLGLETSSIVFEKIRVNQLGFLLACFILSVIGFVKTGYTLAVSESDHEYVWNVIEIVFSCVHLIETSVYLSWAYLGIEFNSYIALIFALVFALTDLALAYKHKEPASPVTTDQMDVELGVHNNNVAPSGVPCQVVPYQPPTAVNGEETATPMVREENPEKSRASHNSSGTTDTSGVEDIGDSKAPTTITKSSETGNSNE